MRIVIGNNLALTDINPQLKAYFIENLTFNNPVYEDAIRHNRCVGGISPTIEMYTSIPGGIIIPRGLLEVVEKGLISKGNIKISDERILLEPLNQLSLKPDISLRAYQLTAKKNLLKHPNGILVAPAGSGKTVLGLDTFVTLKQRALWITHTKRLLNQTINRIDSITNVPKEKVGIIGSGKWIIGDEITVALVQTLIRNTTALLELGREFGLVIIDEAHHQPSSTFLKVAGYFYAYYMYGLTATPYRRDKLEPLMFAAIGNANAKIHREIVSNAEGIITPQVIIRLVPSVTDESNDYHRIMNEIIIPNKARSSIISTDVIKEARLENNCIVICTRKIYCDILYDLIRSAWAKTGVAHGNYGDKHNREQIKALEDGDISVLITTFELLGEGFDVPKLNRGFIALPFRERVRVEQAVGRIQRPCEGKANAILYDYVDHNIGILNNQFRNRNYVYEFLGMEVQ